MMVIRNIKTMVKTIMIIMMLKAMVYNGDEGNDDDKD